jgi:NAD(P)H-hydrate epimerase
MQIITENQIINLIKPRQKTAHKGTYGRILLICGSKGMAGAAILSARAALRAGSGLVTVCIAEDLFPIIQTAVPEATCTPRETIKEKDIEIYDAIAAGPGMGLTEETNSIIETIEKNYKGKKIYDADALTYITPVPSFVIPAKAGISNAKEPQAEPRKTQTDTIITPHPGEASKLIKTPTDQINKNREHYVHELANKYNTITLLKGNETLITSPNAPETYLNPTGNPGMATAGSGDVLTGIIASLLGQGLPPLEATCAAAYIHGKAGDKAAQKKGQAALIASDIIENLTI